MLYLLQLSSTRVFEVGISTEDNGACLVNDFEFVAAMIGKTEYRNALGTFKLEDSFDIKQNTFGITVDPLQPNRVWWYGRQISTQTAPFMGVELSTDSSDSSSSDEDATNRELTLPTQSFHMDFIAKGQVQEFGLVESLPR